MFVAPLNHFYGSDKNLNQYILSHTDSTCLEKIQNLFNKTKARSTNENNEMDDFRACRLFKEEKNGKVNLFDLSWFTHVRSG